MEKHLPAAIEAAIAAYKAANPNPHKEGEQWSAPDLSGARTLPPSEGHKYRTYVRHLELGIKLVGRLWSLTDQTWCVDDKIVHREVRPWSYPDQQEYRSCGSCGWELDVGACYCPNCGAS